MGNGGRLNIIGSDHAIMRHIGCDAEDVGITDCTIYQMLMNDPTSEVKDGLFAMRLILQQANEKPESPILAMYEPGDWPFLASKAEFHACRGIANVRVIPRGDHVLMKRAYDSIARGDGYVPDPLAKELIGVVEPIAWGLKAELASGVGHPDRWLAALERARSLGYEGTDDQIAHAITESLPNRQIDWSGRVVGGVFCDIAGTLFDDRNCLILSVYQYLCEQEAAGRPITLITGGQLRTTEARLRLVPLPKGGYGIPWKLTGKPIFNGATLETVVDDSPGELSSDRYQIKAVEIITPDMLAA